MPDQRSLPRHLRGYDCRMPIRVSKDPDDYRYAPPIARRRRLQALGRVAIRVVCVVPAAILLFELLR
jgi:hypothetical protein